MPPPSKPVIGITLGDPAGIGPEVTAKALRRRSLSRGVEFCLIGDEESFKRYFPSRPKNCRWINVAGKKPFAYTPGSPSKESAETAYRSLQYAVAALKKKELQALVTAPVSKERIQSLGVKFSGHTELLAEAFNVKQFDMMFVAEELKTVIVTRHIAVRDISKALSTAKIYQSIALLNRSLKTLFKIRRPRVAVCGLNPHAGEGGTIGSEDQTLILPAVKKARKNGINVSGPFAADTLFTPARRRDYDAVIAMYHDQGLIPVKTLYFDQVVNLTTGLPFTRTSPAHGTGFDIAGRDKADPSSMAAAIHLAVQLSR